MECLKRKKNETSCARCKGIYHYIYHEVTTPISVLLLNLYRMEELGNNIRLLNICKRSVKKITSILNVFLTEKKINESTTNVKKALNCLLREYKTKCVFEVNIPDTSELPIAYDAFIIVMKNLIRNTCEHSKRKQPRVWISFERTKQGNILYYLDNGKGICTDYQSIIFDHSYTSSMQEGRGYGLTLSKYLVSQSGGSITCRSDGSSFTEFIIEYPYT